jgi:vacuolar-type H+-ATPase subunit I/STV1
VSKSRDHKTISDFVVSFTFPIFASAKENPTTQPKIDPIIMYQIFKDQLEKSKLILTGVKRNQRLGREAGVEDGVIQKLEEDCKRLEALSAEMDKMQEELRKKTEEAHAALNTLKNRTQTVKKSIKNKYDQTWWTKFGISDKR